MGEGRNEHGKVCEGRTKSCCGSSSRSPGARLRPQGSTARALAPLLALSALATLSSCVGNSGDAIPKKICGTEINERYVRPLLDDSGRFGEYSRLDGAGTRTAPCDLLIDDYPVMEFRFAWSSDAVDPMKYAASENSMSRRLTEPRRSTKKSGHETVIGNDGAISTAACRKGDASYFTLTVRLPKASRSDTELRRSIEKFMGVYMKAALERFDCDGGSRHGTSRS